jgi:DNA polymerase-3 subunit delta
VKLAELRKELKGGTIRPAYLLAGEEPLLRDDALAAIRAAALSGGAEDFNYDRLEGSKTSPAALRDALAALPVMSPHRLVLLREPLATRGPGKALGEQLPDILAELKRQELTVLVAFAAKVDKRSRWVKAFGDEAALVECDAPRGGKAIASFVEQEAKRRKIPLAAGVAQLLADYVGPQLLLLRQEIDKASLLAGLGETIERRHVEAVVSQVSDQPVWDLTDAIGEGRRADAVAMLSRMLSSGVPLPVLLGVIASHFRKLIQVRGGGKVGGPPFALKKLERQARRFSSSRLLSCLDAIHETDLALKGAGALRSDLALERLVLGITS